MDAGWWTQGQDLLSEHVLLALLIVLIVEELGIPLLIPGDLLMILAGIEVSRGNAVLWEVLAIELAATMIGAGLLFFLSRRVGRSVLTRYGRYVGLDDHRVARVEARLRRYQFRAVVIGRLTPGLRVVTPMVAGLAEMDARRFLPGLAVGGFLYLLAYTLLGVFAGAVAIDVVRRLSIPASAGLSLVGLVLLFAGFRAARRSRFLARPIRPSLGSALVAGAIGGVAGLLASAVAAGLLAVVERFARVVDVATVPWSRFIGLLLRWPGFLLIALLVAVIASRPWMRRRRRWVRIAITALVPLLLTLLVVNPVLSGGRFIWTSGAAFAVAVVPAVRCLAFALAMDYAERLMFEGPPTSERGAATRAG